VKIFNYGQPTTSWPPRVMGHEIARRGRFRPLWTVGRHATGAGMIAAVPCGECPDCRARLDDRLPQPDLGRLPLRRRVSPSTSWCRRPCSRWTDSNRVPAGVSFGEASIAEPLACVLNGQELAGVGPGDDCRWSAPARRLPARPAGPRPRRPPGVPGRTSTGLASTCPPPSSCRTPPSAGPKWTLVDAVLKLTDGRGADVVITAAALPVPRRRPRTHKIGAPATLTVNTYPAGRLLAVWTLSTRGGYGYTGRPRCGSSFLIRVATQTRMFVNVSLKVPMGTSLLSPQPASAVRHSRAIAFVERSDGYIEPREVQLGSRVGDDLIVLKGLKAGEQIVTSANFLIDSESQLQAALGSFVPPRPARVRRQLPTHARNCRISSDPTTPQKGSNVSA